MAAHLELALGGPFLHASACVSKKRGVNEWDDERMLQLMMGPVERPSFNSYNMLHQHTTTTTTITAATTLDLFGRGAPPLPPPVPPYEACTDDDNESSCCVELDSQTPLPPGWEKCLDLMTGDIYYLNRGTGLSTSCDPRKATSSVNWPASPASSSDLTFEANAPLTSSTSNPMNKVISGDDTDNLDLRLSLRPSSLSLVPKGHDQVGISESNHKLISLMSSHGLLNNQSFSSNATLPKSSSTVVPTCTTSVRSPSSQFIPELNALKDIGNLGSSCISSKFEVKQISNPNHNFNAKSKPISVNHNINAKSKPISSNNLGINVNSKPFISNNVHHSPMITVGCANCLMFVMLPKSCSPKCPRCGASIDTDLPQPPSKKAKLGFSSFL